MKGLLSSLLVILGGIALQGHALTESCAVEATCCVRSAESMPMDCCNMTEEPAPEEVQLSMQRIEVGAADLTVCEHLESFSAPPLGKPHPTHAVPESSPPRDRLSLNSILLI